MKGKVLDVDPLLTAYHAPDDPSLRDQGDQPMKHLSCVVVNSSSLNPRLALQPLHYYMKG